MSARKSPERRVGRGGTKDIGLVGPAPAETPPLPTLGGREPEPGTIEAWQAFWASDLVSLVQRADRAALVRLFESIDLRARFLRLALKEPMVAGSTGQPRMNPALQEIASLDSRILALEDRFGLSPASRFRLGIVLGAARRSLDDLDDDEIEAAASGEFEDPRITIQPTGPLGPTKGKPK